MSNELSILALYGLLVLVQILVHVLAATPPLGLPYLVGPRDEPRELTGVPGRCKRAADNAVVALALFAPAVLLVQARGAFTPDTLLAARAFLLARLAYAVLYPLGLPWLRTLAWLVGFIATACLYFAAL
ncbi:MAG: MAPEG family protein [Paracoccaceae bacterium]